MFLLYIRCDHSGSSAGQCFLLLIPSIGSKNFPRTTSFTKFSTGTQLKSATVAWTIRQKSSREKFEEVTSKLHDKRPQCNCWKKAGWTMKRNCQVENVVYKCDVRRPFPKKVYPELADGEWKSRFYNQKLSFKQKIY